MTPTRILYRYVLPLFLIYNMALPGLPLRGFPDYGAPSYLSASVLTDPAEVYNRLAGFASLDGQGRVLLMDTFGDGLAAWTATAGAGGTPPVVVTTPLCFISPNSVIVDPGVGGIPGYSVISRGQILGQSKRIGFEAAFQNVGILGANTTLEIQYNFNGTHYLSRLKYLPASGIWQVQTPTGLQTLTTQLVTNAYIQAKIITDFSTGQYARAVIGENVYDASTFAVAVSAGQPLGKATYAFLGDSIGAGTTPIRLGYVLITRDEP